MANLFDTAVSKATDKKTKKNDKLTVNIPGKDFDNLLIDFVQTKSDFDRVKSRLAMVQGMVKDVSVDKYVDLYKSQKKNPSSFIITSDSNASFQMVPTDGYLSINKERADELKDKYGDGIVTEDTKFAFNPDLLAKYAQVISDLIQTSQDIDPEDKGKLIVAEQKFSVSKGTIDKALTVGVNVDVKEFIEDVQPTFQMKYTKKGN